MWRIIQGIPRVLRGEFHGPVITQAPQAISRDEEHEGSDRSPWQQSRALSASTNKLSHRTEWFNQRSKRDHHEEGARGDADTEWGEWIHSFTHAHSTFEAIRCGTALLLGLQLTQVINFKHRNPNRCLVRRLHMWAVPQTCAGVLGVHNTRRIMAPHHDGAEPGINNTEQTPRDRKTSTSSKTSDHNFETEVFVPVILEVDQSIPRSEFGSQTDSTKKIEAVSFEIPHDLCQELHDLCQEQDDLCPQAHDLSKERHHLTQRSYELSEKSSEVPHNLCDGPPDLRTISQNQPLSHESPKSHDTSHDFGKNWQNISDLYTNMRYNSVATSLANQGDYRGAVLLWRQASSQGHHKAQYNLAVCYETGRGVEKDGDKAWELYTSAARGGHAKSMYNLALMYLDRSEESGEKDTLQAMDLLNQAAKLGLAKAQVDLGVLYTHRTREDWLRASELFEMAANQKSVLGQFYLGVCYEQGWGVQRDVDRAADLYRQAATAGHVPAKENLTSLTGQNNIKPSPDNKQKNTGRVKKVTVDSSLSSSSLSSLGSHLDFTLSDFSDSLLSTGSSITSKPKPKSKRRQFAVNVEDSSDSDWSCGSDSGHGMTGGQYGGLMVAGDRSKELHMMTCS